MSKVIIGTGLSGLVGSRFVDLHQNKYLFENLDLSTGIDITREEAVDQAVSQSQAEAVVHFAAFTNVNEAFKQANDKTGLCYLVNVVGTENIAKACAKYDKYLIHISTDFIFDGTKTEPYTEEDQPNPIEWYGQTKLLAEEVVKKSGSNFAILRLAYPYSVGHPTRMDIIRNIIQKLKEGSMYPPFADHTITPTFIDDIAEVLDLVIKQKPQNQVYHMVGSSWHSDYEIALLVQKVFGLSGEIKPGSLDEYLKTTNRPYQKTMKISNAKLIKDIGYTPKTLEEGLMILKSQLESN